METKLCTSCNLTLSLSLFGTVKATGKPKSYCRKCCSAKHSEYHARNREKLLPKMRAYQKQNAATLQPKHSANLQARRVANKLRLIEELGGKCICCGYTGCREAFDFHHIDEKTKSFDIAKSTWKAWDLLWAEAQKCVLACARCHRELHAGFRILP